MTPPKLAGRTPEVPAGDLIAGLVPPPVFAAARFDTYRPGPAHPSQRAALEAATALVSALRQPVRRQGPLGSGLLRNGIMRRRRPPEPQRGLYFDGGFGVGKTHLLAALWHDAPAPKSYATFAELTSITGLLGMTATVDALSSHRLLAVDEFELDDPGDTVLISTLLGRLAEQGVVLAATSNTQPEDLGEGGFAAADFRREIQGLAERFDVVRVDGPDYRRRGVEQIFAEPSQQAALEERLAELSGATCDNFNELLDHLAQLHPSRYGRLIAGVPMVGLTAVTALSDEAKALRLVVLVDRLYDCQTPVAYCGARLDTLFEPELLAGPHRKKYQRALSRLGALSRELPRVTS